VPGLYGGVLDDDRLPLNLARYVFLEPHSRDFFLDWDSVADDMAGALRVVAGRNPHDRSLSDLIGELSTRSEAFATRWARQNVRLHRTAGKRLHNRVVGDLELTGDALELVGDGLTLIAYTADAGSPAEDQLRLLAAWSAPGTAQPTVAARHGSPPATNESPDHCSDQPDPKPVTHEKRLGNRREERGRSDA
jgi:MmyB-like transcription regulator ligand binding domain